MDALATLIAKTEIAELKARYCRAVDTKDWKAYRGVFADKGTFDITTDMPEGGLFTDPDLFVENASRGLTGVISVHHVHNPEIEMLSDTSAKAIWAMEDMLQWTADSGAPGQKLHGMGHYTETYEKQAKGWVITSLILSRLRLDFTPGE